jgi:acyl-CoA synthetase (NDP forming)
MVIYPTPPMYTSGAVAKAIIPVVHNTDKPVVVVVMGERLIQEAVEHLRAAQIPEYRFPERAAAALSALVDRSELLEFAKAEPVVVKDVKPELVCSILERLNEPSPRENEFLHSETNLAILEAYGIPTMKMELARNPGEAVMWSRKKGFPVALKIASVDIPHKSDVGGVILDLGDDESVRTGFTVVMHRAQETHPDAVIQGVHVQKMVPSGQEVIVGAVQDPQFGALVMFGSGGIEVEGLKDVAFALAPLTNLEAEEMLQSTWAGRKLKGFRNLPPADRDAVLDVLFRLAQLAADHPQLGEIEINPLRVLPDGKGAVAVDVRIKIAK